MLIVEPVVMRPWLAEWETAKAEIASSLEKEAAAKSAATRTRRRREAERLLSDFLKRLRAFTVLDPACGSGNFLYLALHALKDLEHRVQLEAEALGLEREFPAIGPANVRGIEINPYAAELARVSVWIGEIQWMRRNGFSEIARPDPEAARHHRMPGRDSDPGGRGARVARGRCGHRQSAVSWRSSLHAEVILGRRIRLKQLSQAYTGRVVLGGADLVCYWFNKAGELVDRSRQVCSRVGLVATNSITGRGESGSYSTVIVERASIFDAWTRMRRGSTGGCRCTGIIHLLSHRNHRRPRVGHEARRSSRQSKSDLTPGNERSVFDLTQWRLPANRNVAFDGPREGRSRSTYSGRPGARNGSSLPANPNGRTNADVLKPWAQWHGCDPAVRRINGSLTSGGDVARATLRSTKCRSLMGAGTCLNRRVSGTASRRFGSFWWIATWTASSAEACGRSAQRLVSLHRNAGGRQAPPVRLVRCCVSVPTSS